MTCEDGNAAAVFSKFRLSRSCALSLSNNPSYVLHFAVQSKNVGKGEKEDKSLFAAAISGSNEIKIYSTETFCMKTSLIGHTQCITGICFDRTNPLVIWSTSLDGTLRYWNIEEKSSTGHIVYEHDTGITSFDISCDGSLLLAGTERKDETSAAVVGGGGVKTLAERMEEAVVSIKVWDIRKLDEKLPKCIATFESIHSDDVTKILFHPTNPKIVCTGSTDGLVSILDLTTYDEEDALLQTLNTESTVESFGFFGPNDEFLYVLTSVDSLQIWQYLEGEMLSSMVNLKDSIDKSHRMEYIIDCIYHTESKRLFVLAGSHKGNIEILHLNLDKVEPYQSLKGGHSSTVRCIKYVNNCFFTGAEDGMVCSWMALPEETLHHVDLKKTKKARKASRKNPYNAVKK